MWGLPLPLVIARRVAAKRSRPVSGVSEELDCVASLAMTMWGVGRGWLSVVVTPDVFRGLLRGWAVAGRGASPVVIPAQAGIHKHSGCGRSLMVRGIWIPACAGMTVWGKDQRPRVFWAHVYLGLGASKCDRRGSAPSSAAGKAAFGPGRTRRPGRCPQALPLHSVQPVAAVLIGWPVTAPGSRPPASPA